ncbi:hypothetical protein KL921_003761 [Ogataea angusta]|uniref:GPI mannosyltransferase 2 n=1 Tax=Pichia angusta TaxID=870730 RepID=A0AAN6DD23_PICAN|nr:uncharacterized protein KL928_004001 [Ogataea angusta]KAG7808679.1 hypothetical protein KL921_003761 [Ogataea angusta]KAG7817266.1 hypothetical protein KL928_004001 [Ogataea angusta]KAG7828771.1 hypothetical protein KL920_003267 [Ogataea angusta]KAG7833291.1 hypothetical protein KL943_004156 [Ogataea angusta]KAG7839249.1 hypothetical protein KL942_003611 [Ogataea angusta]
MLLSFVLLKLAQLLIVYFAPSPFDTSTGIFLADYSADYAELPQNLQWFVSNVASKLVAWDAIYFLKLATEGPTFEHEYVFGPLWWRLLALVPSTNVYYKLLGGLLISNISHYLSCVVLYKLTRRYFDERTARNSAYLAVIQPSGIFSTTIYAESTAQLLCYTALLLRSYGRTSPKYFLSGILIAIAFGFRSNCLLYGILYLYDTVAGQSLVKHPAVHHCSTQPADPGDGDLPSPKPAQTASNPAHVARLPRRPAYVHARPDRQPRRHVSADSPLVRGSYRK